MPRKPRIYLPGIPCHVIQRGNNRDACFYSDQDYRFYLDCLERACSRYKVLLHAYVLMTNHVHLLMTPSDAYGISRVMQSLGRRYVQYINRVYRRSGTLWEGRHKASIVDAEKYLLTCMRYIELNPVRAGMVAHPGEYPWSSYRVNGQGEHDALITLHECYARLGDSVDVRCHHYRSLMAYQLDIDDIHAIRSALIYSLPLGDERFIDQIEAAIGRSVGYAKRGRPGIREKEVGYIL
ncbi:MAG: transposase [Candidatus Thiodiazotropha sp. (ex Monitilora ramsayi)]|nr:transposase [Candidatus Thiodiazotropha sp. (ex Monitilora ramsayi)]